MLCMFPHLLVCNELRCAATKLVIGQYFWVHPTGRSWAWLVVGSFYDSKDRELWHIELFLGCRDIVTPEASEASSDTSETSEITEISDLEIESEEESSNSFSHVGTYLPSHYPRNNTYPFMMSSFGNGWNPQFGMDPNARQPFGVGLPSGFGQAMGHGTVNFSGILPGPNNQGPSFVIPQNGYNHPVPVFPGQASRLPNPHPVVNEDAPALNLSNSTGGVGCEPGYNYFFPSRHTKLHILKSSTAPWRVSEGMAMTFGAYHVPVHTTLAALLEGFGATNPFPKKNRITEIIQGGNGKWYRSVTFAGDNPDAMKKTLADLGWDETRTGRPGEKPVIWLWITKD
ncbi:hypothetical protein GGR53DRAFT_521113 [Hypoxylon sp. FL1150]|nr:hypothetical protein GGR53DRAFT_521113 [Hypoxylon sp. FL1150]